ncbi:SMP-30/gluconolactonase/LRE family protein [Methylobacterium sp. 17Sr1-1]|uniref:SMP-30/gluconolactonase/LRE family protein n=1 Tax=Methylobacterium sp. 17Sr1-1 TaxID=2202826 RepID=UPI000D6F72BC|nr:SMP-30/gluconolactonase/LRE family protein [Methylobacterium sp. 17Sr1-1]AWN50982.1 gluconolactonase [Methylobacterium sp. 17Sr1-1]
MFFAPPPAVTAEIFTRLPDRYRKPKPTAWADANRGGEAIDSFLEGPVFDRQGRLYVTDIPHGRIFRIDPDGTWDLVAEYDGWPNGLKIHRDGRIFITCYKRGIMLLDPDSGSVTPFLETAGSEGFRGVNDLTFAENGDLYFTDQGQTGLQNPTGRVYRLRASGELTCLIDTVPSPNGIVIDTAMKSLFVAVTRAQQIWRIPLNGSGLVAKVGVFAQLHGGMGGPDGIALDEEGCLIVAHTGFGSIWRLSPVAEPLLRVKSPAGLSTTNVAYGGPDRRTLFITESATGSILTAPMPAPGQALFSHT